MIELITTVVGWNVPNGTNLGNGIVAFILPLIVMGLFAGIPIGLGIRGSFVTLMMMLGLLIGGVLGMMTLVSGATPSTIPFAIPLIAAFYFVMYIWKGRA